MVAHEERMLFALHSLRMPMSDLDELFARTLTGDYDDDEPWKAVNELRSLGTHEVFERAKAWCSSNEALKRARGADVLAQLGRSSEDLHTLYRDEAFGIIHELIQREKDLQPLGSALSALGFLENPLAVPLLCEFAFHEDSAIRFDVACALGSYPNEVESAAALVKLAADTDSDVRDWATFGLGVLGDLDSGAIRDALFRNLKDTEEDVREEAMVGLSKRGDLRVVPMVIEELGSSEFSMRADDAVEYLLGEEWADREPEECIDALRAMLAR